MDSEDVVTIDDSTEDDRIELLPHEEELILSTMNDDVLMISAKGLGIERLCLHHLHMYSDPKVLVLVINANPRDEHFFLTKLKQMNPECPPKVLTSDVLTKQREAIYLEGGVQFITSRLLMVDLLTDRVPVKNVSGIVVLRAHELLRSYQESFILRLYREKKSDGFVKAFTDNPTAITSTGIGQLQRLFDKLYVKNVRLLPRFDTSVKESFDKNPPDVAFLEVDIPANVRRIRMALMDIVRTCVRELKSTVQNLDIEFEDDALSPAAALYPSKLEQDLKKKTLLLTDRQQRILADLVVLRDLLKKVENLDPFTAYSFLKKLRSDKEFVEKNSGWLFTQTTSTIFSGLTNLCKFKTEGKSMVAIPPKWESLKSVLNEIQVLDLKDEDKVLLITPSEECSRQLVDVMKFGIKKYQLMLTKNFFREMGTVDTPGVDLPSRSLWNPDCIVLYSMQIDFETERREIVSKIQIQQKKDSRKRKLDVPGTPGSKQTNLVSFGVVKYKQKKQEKTAEKAQNETPKNDDDVTEVRPSSSKNSSMMILLSHGDRYTLIKTLEDLKPRIVILYHTDIASVRILDTYNALNPERKLKIYNICYKGGAEEERYLLSIERENLAFEKLIREQAVLMVPNEYDVGRESTTKLRTICLKTDSRVMSAADEERSKIIVDMREFNAELPTVLYKNGIDLIAVTLEVGDYILSPNVCVERKALDDLAQSLNSGRIFKQIEQMLRHYSQTVLLIESNEKFKHRKVNGGPFQGELSRRSRDTRALLTMLIRTNPKMRIIWAGSPKISAGFFEEIKLNQANPDVDTAVGIRSDDVGEDDSEQVSSKKCAKKNQINPVMKRQLLNLHNIGSREVEKIMSWTTLKTPKDLFTSDVEELKKSGLSESQALSLNEFFNTDFRSFEFHFRARLANLIEYFYEHHNVRSMGSSLCKPRTKKIATSSFIANENDNPFEFSFTKKERILLRETYQRLNDPKEVVGRIFMDIVNDTSPELKKVFGVDRAPKATMLKMPKFGGHVARMTDFIEQMTSMLGFTENIVGAWQLVRKTGRLHVKVKFLQENQNQLEKNYFTIVTDYFVEEFIAYLTGQKEEPNPASKDDDKKVRFAQNYSQQQISDAWRRFFTLVGNQFTESFEIERQKSLSSESKKTLDPHQHFKEEADKKKRIKERQSEFDTTQNENENERGEDMFEDPF